MVVMFSFVVSSRVDVDCVIKIFLWSFGYRNSYEVRINLSNKPIRYMYHVRLTSVERVRVCTMYVYGSQFAIVVIDQLIS